MGPNFKPGPMLRVLLRKDKGYIKIAKRIAILLGTVPIIGWLISIPYNWWTMGTSFTTTGEWNNLPLWLITAPLNRICEKLFDTHWFAETP